MPDVIDYSDTDYAKTFWEGQNREYEDAADRMAIQKLLPQQPAKLGKILELGAGFGRLCPEYASRFDEVVLFDYAQNLLDQAKQKLGGPEYAHVFFERGDIYRLPFDRSSFDFILMVRVSHHLEDFAAVIQQIAGVLKPGGTVILEYANKRHALEILRALTGKSRMHPFQTQPESRTDKIFYNYHPSYIQKLLKDNGLTVTQTLSVSNFRSALAKKLIPAQVLAQFEKVAQILFAPIHLGPSIYVKAVKH